MFNSLRTRITLLVTGLIFLAGLLVIIFVQREAGKELMNTQHSHAKNLVDSMLFNVENEYASLLYFKQSLYERRKSELKNVVTLVLGGVNYIYQRYEQGQLTLEEAQHQAIEEIRSQRYDEGVGYIWVNDMGEPYPRMIMHPTLPELNGTVLDDKKVRGRVRTGTKIFSRRWWMSAVSMVKVMSLTFGPSR